MTKMSQIRRRAAWRDRCARCKRSLARTARPASVAQVATAVNYTAARPHRALLEGCSISAPYRLCIVYICSKSCISAPRLTIQLFDLVEHSRIRMVARLYSALCSKSCISALSCSESALSRMPIVHRVCISYTPYVGCTSGVYRRFISYTTASPMA